MNNQSFKQVTAYTDETPVKASNHSVIMERSTIEWLTKYLKETPLETVKSEWKAIADKFHDNTEITGTREAFEALIKERGVYKRLDVSRSTVATWKIYLKEGKKISIDKMEEILIRSGATVKQEKIWII